MLQPLHLGDLNVTFCQANSDFDQGHLILDSAPALFIHLAAREAHRSKNVRGCCPCF